MAVTGATPSDNISIPPARNTRRIIFILVGLIGLAVIVLLASVYSSRLGARVAPGLPFALTGPKELFTGQPAVITWNTSPENQRAYPTEKIELCQGALLTRKCVVLASATANDGEALVTAPTTLKLGAASLQFIPRTTAGKLATGRLASLAVNLKQGTGRVISPSTVNGKPVATITGSGPRIGVNQQARYKVILPQPTKAKKVELCGKQGTKPYCRVLAASAKGDNVIVQIPVNAVLGAASIKTTERLASGALGPMLFNRAVLVKARVIPPEPESGGGGGSSGGGGGGGGGGGSEQTGFDDPTPTPDVSPTPGASPSPTPSTSVTPTPTTSVSPSPSVTPTVSPSIAPTPSATPSTSPSPSATPSPSASPSVTPTPTVIPSAEFIVPADDEVWLPEDPLDVRVKLTQTTNTELVCQEWKLDGVPLPASAWVPGQAPLTTPCS